jgi:hypothetical protein
MSAAIVHVPVRLAAGVHVQVFVVIPLPRLPALGVAEARDQRIGRRVRVFRHTSMWRGQSSIYLSNSIPRNPLMFAFMMCSQFGVCQPSIPSAEYFDRKIPAAFYRRIPNTDRYDDECG